MKPTLLFIFLIPFISNLAWGVPPQDWRAGLDDMYVSADVGVVEKFGVFIKSKSGEGRWIFPKPKSQSATRLRIDKNSLLISIAQQIETMKPSADEEVSICVAHTHPRLSIIGLINQEVKGGELNGNVDFDQPLTMPPSLDDVWAFHDWQKMAKKLNHSKVKIYGLVIDPVGLYTYRYFSNRREREDLFPRFSGVLPYNEMDLADQHDYDLKATRDLSHADSSWIKKVNNDHSHDPEFHESPEYSYMQESYAAYGHGVLLTFENRGSNQPCGL